MKTVLMVVALISFASAQRATAEPPERGERERAPRLLGEALRSGTADAETIATIVRWVLEEKEEKVAPALAAALGAAAGDLDAVTADPRWSAAARGAIALFEGLLDDARSHRRRDEGSVARDLAPIIDAAAPAVADALREADAPTRHAVIQAWKLFAPALRECAR
jgi:hypothetical protein